MGTFSFLLQKCYNAFHFTSDFYDAYSHQKKKKQNMVDHFSFEGNPFGSVFPKFFAYGLNTYSIVHILHLAKAF